MKTNDPWKHVLNSVSLDPRIQVRTQIRNEMSDQVYMFDTTSVVDMQQKSFFVNSSFISGLLIEEWMLENFVDKS